MTKKDYIIIAKVLASLRDYEAHCFDNDEDLGFIIDEFAKELHKDNKRFNLAMFKHQININLQILSDNNRICTFNVCKNKCYEGNDICKKHFLQGINN